MPKIKNFFLVIPLINKYKIGLKKILKNFLKKVFIPKSFFVTRRLLGLIESDSVVSVGGHGHDPKNNLGHDPKIFQKHKI